MSTDNASELAMNAQSFTDSEPSDPSDSISDIEPVPLETLPESDEDSAWRKLATQTRQLDREIIDDWKEELNNLLIYAGLFSAVITAFTTESYQWLKRDSSNVSTQLLAQISLQLASFTITGVMMNSSAPALSVQSATGSFSPDKSAIQTNTLWVLSLTLSLLVALSTIAVQQWLRRARMFEHLPPRTELLLHFLRFPPVQRSQVSTIISLLSLSLQMALILFLAGLFLLFNTLCRTVAYAFAAVAGTGILLFTVAAIAPLFKRSFIYKTPLVPSIFILLQAITFPLVFAVTSPLLAFMTVCNARPLRCIMAPLIRSHLYRKYVNRSAFTVYSYLHKFNIVGLLKLDNFWTDRELGACPLDGDPQGCRFSAEGLLAEGLTWDPLEYPVFNLVKSQLLALEPKERIGAFIDVFFPLMRFSSYFPLARSLATQDFLGDWTLIHRASLCISPSYIQMLIDVGSSLTEDHGWSLWDAHLMGTVLVLGQQAVRGAASPLRDAFGRFVWHLHCQQPQLPDSAWTSPAQFMPAIIAFENWRVLDMDSGDIACAMSWATFWHREALRPRPIVPGHGLPEYPATNELARIIRDGTLAPTAMSFMHLHYYLPREIHSFCRSLLAFLRVYGSSIRDTGGAEPERGFDGYPRPFDTTPRAIAAITVCLTSLADDGHIVIARDTPAGRLTVALREICADLESPYFQHAWERLDRYADNLNVTQADAVLEDAMAGFVAAERRLMRDRSDIPVPDEWSLASPKDVDSSSCVHTGKTLVPCFVLR